MKHIMLYNLNTGEVFDRKKEEITEKELLEFNKKGFNIYESINSFAGKRRKENLLYYEGIGIDIDFLDDYKIIKERLKKINLIPSKINKTYKGYHIYFDFSEELKEISEKDYNEIVKKINKILGGDVCMRTTTGLLKMEGFLDKKEGRDFLIKNIYKSDNKITKKQIEDFLKDNIKIEYGRAENILKKEDNKKKKNSLINSIDAIDFIKTINYYLTKYKYKRITISGYSIEDTSGLKLYYNKDTENYQIKDFSGHNRFGNVNFLMRILLKKEVKKDDIIKIRAGVLFEYGLHDRENIENKTKIDQFFFLSFFGGGLVNQINQKIIEEEEGADLFRLLLLLNINKEKGEITYNEIINELGYYNNTRNKKKIKTLLLKLSFLKSNLKKFIIDENSDNIIEVEGYVNIINLVFLKNKKTETIKFKIRNFSKKFNFNKDILKIKNNKAFLTACIVNYGINSLKGVYKININDLLKISGYSSYESFRDRILSELKKQKIIKKIIKTKNYLIFY